MFVPLIKEVPEFLQLSVSFGDRRETESNKSVVMSSGALELCVHVGVIFATMYMVIKASKIVYFL